MIFCLISQHCPSFILFDIPAINGNLQFILKTFTYYISCGFRVLLKISRCQYFSVGDCFCFQLTISITKLIIDGLKPKLYNMTFGLKVSKEILYIIKVKENTLSDNENIAQVRYICDWGGASFHFWKLD